MKGLGIVLIIIGAGSFILPQFGIQFRLMSAFGENQPIAAAVAIGLGLLLVFLSLRKKPDARA
jgi:hypothetical protein